MSDYREIPDFHGNLHLLMFNEFNPSLLNLFCQDSNFLFYPDDCIRKGVVQNTKWLIVVTKKSKNFPNFQSVIETRVEAFNKE